MGLQKKALMLVVVPGLLYLAASALVPDQYRITHPLKAGPQTALKQANSTTGARTLGDLLSQPDLLFDDQEALMDLNQLLYRVMPRERGGNSVSAIRAHIQDHMRLEPAGASDVVVVYSGSELPTGRILVNFYAQQLVQRLDGPPLRLQITPDVEAQRVLWRIDRLVPTLWITILSLVFMLLFLVLLEWMDPSLKTVRQTARYLEIPVLGAIPNLQRLSEVLKLEPERKK